MPQERRSLPRTRPAKPEELYGQYQNQEEKSDAVIEGEIQLFILCVCFLLLVMCGIVGFFFFLNPIVTGIVVVTILTIGAISILYFLTKEDTKKVPQAYSAFFQPIIFSNLVRSEFKVAEANEAWWLIFPGAWLMAALMGFAAGCLSVLVAVLDLFFSDTVASIILFFPRLANLLGDHPWAAFAFLATAFIGFSASALRRTFWLAIKRSQAVKKDPRINLLLRLVRTVEWWNKHLPVFNDLKASGNRQELIDQLVADQVKLRNWLIQMENRLTVAPLGSFPQVGEAPEIPEFAELSVLIDGLKQEPLLDSIKASLEELKHPERILEPEVVRRWEETARFLKIKIR